MVREGHPFSWDHDGCRVVMLSLRVPVGKGHQCVGEKIQWSEPVREQNPWCETDCLHCC